MEFSPPKRLPKQLRDPSKDCTGKNPEEEDTKPVLILKPFSPVPHVSFDKVKLGCVKTSVLYVFNPLEFDQVVRVEKFPTDKGFSIETGELYVKAGVESALKITWAPVKATSFRETVGFRSSSGCKNQAYLLGTAYSPVKKVQQRTASKSRTGGRKVFPERIAAKNEFWQDLKIYDEKKENLGEKELGKFEPRVSFCLKTIEELPDSPIRRQTYTINSMLRNADVLPFRPIQSNDNVKLPSQSRLSSNFNSLNNIKLSREFMQFPPPLASTFHTEDNLNDSLENKIDTVFFEDLKGPSSEAKTPCSSQSFDRTSVKDSVVTYDKESKHKYFGYTPKQPGKNSKLLENGSHKNTDFDLNQSVFYPPGQEQVPSVQISDFDAPRGSNESIYGNHNCHPLSSSSFAKQCVLLKKEPYKYSFHVGKDIAPGKNYELINDWQSLNIHSSAAHDFSETLESRGFEASNIEMTQDYEDMNVCQAFKLSAENSVNEQPLKESKKAFFLEISCDSKNVSSDLPKKYKTNSTLSAHSLKKSQKSSPFKAKVLKSRMLSNKDGDKVASKAYAVLKNKEKRKFLPKKLSLSKSRMTDSVVYHRNPYASMNIYYDEHWIEKQEVAFTSWLNFILTPNEDCGSESFKVDSAKLWVESIKENSSAPAPTKEELSLKAYTAVKNLNMLRKLSSNLYQSEEVVAVIKKIEREVELKKLNIRPDRAIQADLGIKKDILEMLLSYNTLWLRIGLETIYGEVLNLQNNSDVLGLSRFIVHRFLQSPDIASKYSHPAVINYYKKGYEDAIQRFILKKFLLLVFFLDTAKTNHLIKHNPCLFNKNAKYKSSRELLLVFSREYLSGEGDITKHLRYLGYKVTYQQTALEEFDYSVRNIATDLRCGLRLGRVVELLLQDWTISERLRINTLNRLTKIHNNDVILKSLKNASIEIENNIEAKHITDGDREKTLDLLWQIIFKTEISQLINTDLLKKENAFLLKSLKLRADFAAFEALRRSESVASSNELSILESKLYKENEILQLLFKWCQNVCAHYNIRVYNFTSSFSDGVALCVLLHHYLPNVLPYASIKMETSRSYFEQQMIISENDDSCPFMLQDDQQNLLMEKLLKNERDNLSLVFQKFQEVGNIPVLCTPSNLSNTMPDEKVMVTLLSYINIRLLDLSIEIRAARIILHAWKKYKLRKYHQRLKIEIKAVKIIQRTWRRYIGKKTYETHYKAALKVQSFWRMHLAQKILIQLKHKASLEWQNQNAVVIQAAYRGYLLRKKIASHHKSATVIQSFFRRWYLRSKFVKLKNTVIKIQQHYRAKVIGRKQRLHYVNTQYCVVRLQAYARGMLARKHFKNQQLSAVKIQAYVRMWLEKRKYNKMRNACITIQRKFRGYLMTEFLREEYQNFRNAAILIQTWYRSACIQRHEKKCIVKTQACIRRFIARKKYLTSLKSAVKIQTWWRAVSVGRKTRLSYIQSYKSIICVQSIVRQFIAKRNYERQKKAAVVIQKHVRAFIVRRKFKKIKDVTIKIQRAWRLKILARKTRSDYLQFRKKVIFAQSLIRRFIAVHNFKTKKCAAVIIQKNARALIERKRFCLLKSNTIFIQRKWRAIILARKARANFLLYRHHVVFIQSIIRRQLAFHDFQRKKECAIVIQKIARMFIARQNFLKLKKSVILIENKWHSILLGRKVRKNFLACRKSAVIIQSYYRMHYCKQNFLKRKKSAIIIQRYYAAYKVMCTDRQNYTVLKKGIIKFQALYRGWYVRKNLETLNKKATVIQSFFRKWKEQSEYKKLRKACIIIQEKYRAKLEMRKCYNNFTKMKTAAIKIQAGFRCHIIHKQFKHLKSSVIKIQSCFRMIKCYKAYCHMKKAAVVIQRYFRLYKLTSETQRNYLQKRSCLIKIQSKARAVICRRKFLKEKKACIFIQSLIRMNIQRRKYLQKRNATIQIQRYFKNWCLMKSDKDKYNKLRKSVIFLQSKVRAKIVRRRFLNQKRACILIQSYSRMHAKRKKYVEIRSAVICIQRFYRNQKVTLVQKNIYIQQRQSVIFLQSKIRSVLTRKRYLKQKKACTLIQSIVRMYIQRKMYLKFQQASVVLQKNYRSWKLMQLQRSRYLLMRKATIVLQSALRSAMARREYLKIKHSCIKIQALFRMLICRNKFIKSKRAATLIQTYFRHWRLMKIQQNSYIKTKKALIMLQSNVRSWLARKKFIKTKASCVLLQSYFRMYVQRKKYCKLREATIILQRFYRNRQIAEVHRDNFLKMKKTAIFMQSRVRCALARKKYLKQKRACITIQSFVRMSIQRTQYNRTLNAVLVIQRWFKNCKISAEIRARYLSLQRSCIILQSYVRMHKYRMQFIRLRASALFIQRKYRAILLARKVRQNYLEQKEACIKVQSYVRMVIAVQKFKKLRLAAITLQSQFRGYKARKEYSRIRKAVIALQTYFKSWMMSKKDRNNFLQLKSSATAIQSAVRGYFARKNFKLQVKACVMIQAYVRGYICRKKYVEKRNATVTLQKYIKAYICAKRAREEFIYKKKCIIITQAVVRGYLTRCHIEKLQYSATKIQTTFRTYTIRRHYIRQKESAIIIQKHFRAVLLMKMTQKNYAKLKYSTILIQSAFRKYKERKEYLRKRAAVILLQTHFRKLIARSRFVKLKNSVRVIENYYLSYKMQLDEQNAYQMKKTCCIKIQALWRGYMARKKLRTMIVAASKIQRAFRSWRERNMFTSMKSLISNKMNLPRFEHLWYLCLRRSTIAFQRAARAYMLRRNKAVLTIQSWVKMWIARKQFRKLKAALKIQACWRGYCVRRSISNKKVTEARHRIRAADGAEANKLKNRTTHSLETLWCNEGKVDIGKLLAALKDLDVCTRLSSKCCERLVAADGHLFLIDLIKRCNRSIAHMEIIKMTVNILLNLAKYNKTAESIWFEKKTLSMMTQLMIKHRQNGEAIFSKCCSLLWIFSQDPQKAEVMKEDIKFMEQIISFHTLCTRSLTNQKKSLLSKDIAARSLKSSDQKKRTLCGKTSLIDPDWILGQNRQREFANPELAITMLFRSLNPN